MDKPCALEGGLGIQAFQEAGSLKDAVDRGGAGSDAVGVEHHESQPAVAFPGMLLVEGDNRLFLLLVEPVVAGDAGVVLVDLAVTLAPLVKLAGADADPQQEGENGDAGLGGPGVDEIDDGVAGIGGNPDAFQGSPSSFFSWTCSSMSSARTSFWRWRLSSKVAIVRSLAPSSA